MKLSHSKHQLQSNNTLLNPSTKYMTSLLHNKKCEKTLATHNMPSNEKILPSMGKYEGNLSGLDYSCQLTTNPIENGNLS